jgi:hypothetical protein
MHLCDHGATTTRRQHKSRLGESLLRLQHNLHETHTTEQVAEDQFEEWRDRWSERREQISRRLELIDRQLEHLLQTHQQRPQLSLVAGHSHEDETVSSS